MIYIIGGIVIILVIYIIAVYNKLTKLNNMVKEAFSTMDIYLKKRWDLIPNIVKTVKGYANYEKSTFTKIVELRNGNYDNMTVNKKIYVNEELTESISDFMMTVENYPELKANQNFLELGKELAKVEDDIANSRKYYNGTVRIFNNKIQAFPSNLVAKIFGFNQANMFCVESKERNNVKVDL